jgi:lysyl-tRNA synthetase, class II
MNDKLGATEKDLISTRKIKLQKIKEMGVDPYPSSSSRSISCQKVLDQSDELIKSKKEQTIAGRVIAIRGHGKLCFVDIKDESGKVQAVLKADNLNEEENKLVYLLDLGDFIEVFGPVFATNAGEISIESKSLKILTKTLRPMPEKHGGLKDQETRFRERYVDLLVNDEVKEKFYIRSKIVQTTRDFLLENGFLEVETPILQSIAGGATAKPFQTHYNAYDRDVFLRIAPELYLKRLIVGGFEKVFEFAKCFRNEGVDASHNPEFTNLEFYWAYADYEKLMDFTEEMLRKIVSAINNRKLEIEIGGQTIDFSKKFERITFDKLTNGENTDGAFKEGVKKLIQPTFVTNHPTELIPLAKKNKDNDKIVDTFQLVIGGIELLKAFSELNDPMDQRKRFEDQMELREKGDEEAQILDEDFLKAIEYGMPPTAGWGMGIDRLTKVLTNSITLREILFFPYMRPIEDQKIDKKS